MRSLLLALLIVLVASAAAIWFLVDRDLRELEARLLGRSQLVETSFGSIEYASLGNGHPVLAIHGSGGGFDQGLEFVGPLADHGFRLIAPSRFGYLRTPAPADFTLEQQADAYVDLLDHLGLDKVVVFGGSAGALSAMQFAIRHPERCEALVLLVPASYAPDRRPTESGAESRFAETVMMTALRSDFLFWSAIRLAPDAMTRLILATEPALVHAASQKEQARVRAALKHVLPVSRRAEGLLFDSRTAGNPPPMELEKIACPVLAISAEDDLYGTAASARYVVANVPAGKLLLYPRGGHLLVGHSEQVWRSVASFIAEVLTDVNVAGGIPHDWRPACLPSRAHSETFGGSFPDQPHLDVFDNCQTRCAKDR
ncbi:MAG: alpha/beta hydrolase [Mesorhizobium sp.]|uniref:alpha/beta fold hydrolase n=1 Tax=Mesorhizobium sp. TaxID=1871066 RepID=UPI000FCA730A|nr:alpha/beta hydrolase [Mesorhizobium sp.]RUV69878.1 alpha/beta hydrolase [Mesorhizobium sp. M5C.F.Cr.IN.023.01.1.1]RWF85392.1 MAG: alpha/beta hydrolase [Mesorhizobium sp.]RWF92612.1 MAG: alpha/beta hydrolase [Mesorhizobium sp.]RWI39461.1 MAG: alpha/beta hydrolase [Mesorhizobium sp.]RWI44990.1 MAG: alpha/beta hydrolase [Mesorhizobium sp.]